MATRSIRTFAQQAAKRRLILSVDGLEHLPPYGPVVLAARHYHHLHDATALLTVVPRPVEILVALDWVQGRGGRLLMERACRMARWPIVLRADSPHLRGLARASAYREDEAIGISRRAVRDVTRLLGDGRVLLIFPEAYPVVDPEGAHRTAEQELLPFRAGFARLVTHAQRRLGGQIPIVPVGLEYRSGERWRVAVRFGPPIYLHDAAGVAPLIRQVEAQVRALSGLPSRIETSGRQPPGRSTVCSSTA
jgi:putative membrane protein